MKEMKLSECKRKNFSLFMYYIATVLKITKYPYNGKSSPENI